MPGLALPVPIRYASPPRRMQHRRQGNAAVVRWPLWTVIALLLLACTLAATPARAAIRYDLHGTAQSLSVELRLCLGLWHRRWRVPPRGARRPGRPGAFSHRVQRATVPGDAPHRRPRPGLRSPTWRGVDYLRGRVSLRELRLEANLGTGDAATTALAVGLLHAALGTGLALLPAYFKLPAAFAPAVVVSPDYARPGLRAAAVCIAEARLGHLTCAVLLALSQGWRARRAPGG